MYNVYTDIKITTGTVVLLVCKKKNRVSRYAREISRRIGNEIHARVAAALPKGREVACPYSEKLGSFHKRLNPSARAATGRTFLTPVQFPEGPDRREPR
jgi:hypothetical protein